MDYFIVIFQFVAGIVGAVFGCVAGEAGHFGLAGRGFAEGFDVFGAGAVAVFAADVAEVVWAVFVDETGFVIHTDDVADDAFGVVLGADFDEGFPGVSVFFGAPLIVFVLVAHFAGVVAEIAELAGQGKARVLFEQVGVFEELLVILVKLGQLGVHGQVFGYGIDGEVYAGFFTTR